MPSVDENRGLVYPARVRIEANTITVGGAPARLTPGMSATVEGKTAQSHSLTDITSPIARAVPEAGRER